MNRPLKRTSTLHKEEDLPEAKKSKASRTSSVSLGYDENGQSTTLEMARQIHIDQGHHECQVSCGGEADLHRSLIMCEKNPKHSDFIAVKDFTMQHLPRPYHSNIVLDFIRAWSDLTVRISLTHTSNHRPEFFSNTDKPFPFFNTKGKDMLRTGTGWVGYVQKYNAKDQKTCECEECLKPSTKTPRKVWGIIAIVTAAHVVFDEEESRTASCHFFYDDSGVNLNEVLSLRRFGVESCNLEGDWCRMKYVTHDMGLVNKISKLWDRWYVQSRKLNDFSKNEYKGQGFSGPSGDIDSDDKLAIAVSHPHGCSKYITIGTWTERHKVRDITLKLVDGEVFDGEVTHYTYTTPTCPGSSGAPVFSPLWLWGMHHHHTEGYPGNVNLSGLWWERVPTIS